MIFHQPELRTFRLTISAYYSASQPPPKVSDVLHELTRSVPDEHVDGGYVERTFAVDALYDAADAAGWRSAHHADHIAVAADCGGTVYAIGAVAQ